jgi:LacI family transcriptional regulator
MPGKPPSMLDLARTLGVSRATVSNALRGKGRLSPELAGRIRALAAELRYIPAHAGRALRTGRSATIGLIVPDFGQPLFPIFAQAIERAAKSRGVAVLVGDSLGTAEGQAAEIANLLGRGIDALVIIPTRGTTVDAAAIPVPVAVIDSAATRGNTASSDHRDGGRQVARHLLGLGHRDILLLGGAKDSKVARERTAGLFEGFAEAGITPRIRYSVVSFEAGAEIGAEIDPAGFTACAAAYDALAVGFVTALAARGVQVPQDVSVTGFDDLMWARIVSPPLTTVRQDLAAIADHALAVATGERQGARLFPVELVLRASTAGPRHVNDNRRGGAS